MSKTNQLTEQFSRYVHHVLLEYPLPLTGDTMRKISGILDSICADKKIVKSLKHKSGPAMVNAILGLFGLEAIQKDQKITFDEEVFKSFIEIDKTKAIDQLETIAKELEKFEKDAEVEKNKLIDKIQEQASDVQHLKRDYSDLQGQYDMDKNAYYVSMQRLSEAIGPNSTEERLVSLSQIIESSLEQFGVSVVWEVPKDDKGKMFYVQKTGIKRERIVQRPCFVENGDVVLKGLAYQEVEE